MSRPAIALVAVFAVLAIWLLLDRPTNDSVASLSFRDPRPILEPEGSRKEGNAGNDEPETDHPPQEGTAPRDSAETDTYSEAELSEGQSLAEHLGGSWLDFQSDPGVINFEALQRALDAESIDTNWGPLLEATIMGSMSENQANLLSLNVTCKTTICGVEVRQAGTPEEGLSENATETTFFEWFGEMADLVSATDLGYWRIYLGGVAPESEVTTWRVWVLRTPGFE